MNFLKFAHRDQFAEIVFRLVSMILIGWTSFWILLSISLMIIIFYQTGHHNNGLFDLLNSIK